MNGKFRTAIMVVFCTALTPGGGILAATLSGRVYEGSVGDESKPLAGVTVTLYGSNNSGQQGTYITSTTTSSDGWYGLEAEGTFEYFNIVETDPAGYSSVGAASVDGSVVDSDWIEYSVPLSGKTLTGNKFWDKKEGGVPPGNNPPVAVDDTASTSTNTAVDIDVLNNDSDPDGDPLHINSATDPAHGSTVNHGSRVTYTPDPGFTGTDTFDYTAGDGRGGTDTAQVTVTVRQDDGPPRQTGILDGYKRDADTGTGLENWRIYIDLNGNGQWDTGEPSDLTDGNGYYRIADVEPGTYRVCEQMQAGWEGDQPCVDGVTVMGDVTTTQDFHNRRTQTPEEQTYVFRMCFDVEITLPDGSVHGLSLSGPATARVSIGPNGEAADTDGNGRDDVSAELTDLQLAGLDPVLGSVKTALHPTVPSTGRVEERANHTSGILDIAPFRPNGSADSFFDVWFQVDLPSYGVTVLSSQAKRLTGVLDHLPPANAVHSETTPKTVDLLDQNGQPTGVRLGPVTSCGSTQPPDDFLGGVKFNDLNGNGQRDPGEPGLANWTIWLDTNHSGKQDAGDMTTQTDAQGHFRFTGVPAGTYALGEQLQAGWTQTAPGGAGTYVVTVQPGQASVPQMFGNRQSGGPTKDGRICGSKWNDLNGNGVYEAGEPWLANWKIYLDLNQNSHWDTGEPSQSTDAAGSFEFTQLAAGSYTVAEETQAGWQQTWPGGAGTHVISIQPGGAQPACVMFGNTTRPVPPPDTLKQLDWGDAPEPTYPTLRASNGAYHVIAPGFSLGQGIDGEVDGRPAPDALGDDHFGADDEDGVVFLTPMVPGGTATLEITASAVGFVDAWVDFACDGSWSQSGDQVLTSRPVAAGANVLSVAVPASAHVNVPTFARFRLSRAGGLPPHGPAQDGEVEDYHVLLGEEGPGVPGEGKRPHVKWSQPPIEIDPNLTVPPVFCGWNEAARSTERSGERRQWRMDADDFRCLGPIPITGLRWWGGHKGWDSSEPPALQPEAWHVGFWANQVPGLAPDKLYLERLVWSLEIANERVRREPMGLDEFPGSLPETCFRYELRLEPNEWFHQAEFPSNEGIFWVSITAIYPADAEPVNQWGWTTRPHVWRDGAVMPAIMGEWPAYDERLFPGRITAIERDAPCGQNRPCDLCFELLTDRPWVKWDQSFMGIRDWPECADLESQGISIQREEDLGRVVADDWHCEGHTPVIAVAWWGSYIGHGYEACRCDGQPAPARPDYFLLTISTSTGPDRETDHTRPSDVVWQCRAYDYDEVLVGYDKDPEGEPNEPVFRYSVRLPEENWFRPAAAGSTYWFSVMAVYTDPLPMFVHPWGWTTHPPAFGTGALFIDYRARPRPEWRPLRDPADHPVDTSFTLFTLAQE